VLLILSAILILSLAACLGLSDSDRRYNSGVKLLEEGMYQEAIAEFDLSIFTNVSYATTYHNRALSEEQLGRLASALKDYTKAIELDPGIAVAYGPAAASELNLATCRTPYCT
jgi:tetratricopeptide (TPR) repeat protein